MPNASGRHSGALAKKLAWLIKRHLRLTDSYLTCFCAAKTWAALLAPTVLRASSHLYKIAALKSASKCHFDCLESEFLLCVCQTGRRA